jgi:uncharacterized membrane protein
MSSAVRTDWSTAPMLPFVTTHGWVLAASLVTVGWRRHQRQQATSGGTIGYQAHRAGVGIAKIWV